MVDLEARITALEAELSALRAELARPVTHVRSDAAAPAASEGPAAGDGVAESPAGPRSSRSSRRTLLGAAGAAALGAAAGMTATSAPAGANDPNDLTFGVRKTSGGQTQADYTGAATGAAFLFQGGNRYSADQSSVGVALAGWATSGSAFNPRYGVYGYSETTSGAGVLAGAVGPDVAALDAVSLHGATMRLTAGLAAPSSVPPPTGTWFVGDVLRTSDAELWYCRQGGTGPASVWSRLSGGGLNLLPTPQRAFDSRPGAGPFEGDETRTIGLVGAGVPTGASGALLNVTATDTTGAGYVQVYSAALTSPPATSNLNWYASGQIVANNATSAVDATGQVKVTTQGGIAAIIIDVFGWYW